VINEMHKEELNLTAGDVLKRYKKEELIEFFDVDITDVNQHGHSGDTPLHVACARRDIPEILALLKGGANPNLNGDEGNTPLHNSILNKDKQIIGILLKNGARIDIENEFGVTAQELAKVNDIPLNG
jgi:ankyrin repeat protein